MKHTPLQQEQKLLTPALAIKEFASGLTERVRHLDMLERTNRILPNQSTEILTGMIEGFVYTVIQTLRRQEKGNDLVEIDPEAIWKLLESDILSNSKEKE